jgi:hypothetical protein
VLHILTIKCVKFVRNVYVKQDIVAQMRGVKSGTIVSNLCDCIRAGLRVDIERLSVTKEVENLIVDVVRKPPVNSGLFHVAAV